MSSWIKKLLGRPDELLDSSQLNGAKPPRKAGIKFGFKASIDLEPGVDGEKPKFSFVHTAVRMDLPPNATPEEREALDQDMRAAMASSDDPSAQRAALEEVAERHGAKLSSFKGD